MPTFCRIKTKSHGELFKTCGSKAIAGRLATMGDEDCTILDGYSFSLENHAFDNNTFGSASSSSFHFEFILTLPAYEPTVSAVLNAVNSNDRLESMEIFVYRTSSTGGGSVQTEKYTAKNGNIKFASMEKDTKSKTSGSSNNSHGEMVVVLDFEEMTHENLVSNTAGQVQTNMA